MTARIPLSCKRETITPAKAAEYLEANTHNRKLQPRTVRNYAEEIAARQWQFNGETIKFDRNGVLVDGQHRLAAVVHSKQSIDTFVVRGLDPAAFKTIDTGKARSSGELLAMRGIRSPIAVATAYRALYRYLGRGHKKSRITNTQLLETVDEFPDLVDRAYECMVKPLDCKLYALSTRMFFYYVARRVDADLAHEFLSNLARPTVSRNDTLCARTRAARANAARLNRRLTEVLAEVIPPASGVRWSWLMSAWNASVAGQTVTKFSRMPDLVEWDPKPAIRKRR